VKRHLNRRPTVTLRPGQAAIPKPVKEIGIQGERDHHEHLYWQPRRENAFMVRVGRQRQITRGRECLSMAETRCGASRLFELLGDLKPAIQAANCGASLAVNRELVFLYGKNRRDILARQERESWGSIDN